jgi:hypothetical protein
MYNNLVTWASPTAVYSSFTNISSTTNGWQVYKPLYNTGVSFYNAITNTRRDQENNTITYYKQITNALLRKAIIELRAFRMAFMAVISIRFYSRTKTFAN